MCVNRCGQQQGARYHSELTEAAVSAGQSLSDAENRLKDVVQSDPENYAAITAAQQDVQKAMQVFAQLQKLLENLHQTVMQAIRSLRAQ